MSTSGFEFVVLVIVAFTLFGCVLGWVSWEETCASRKKRKLEAEAGASKDAKSNTNGGGLNATLAHAAHEERHQRRAF